MKIYNAARIGAARRTIIPIKIVAYNKMQNSELWSSFSNEEMVDGDKYHFIDNDDLQKDFMSGAGISTTNIPEKVYFYIYTITKNAFLKVYLRTGSPVDTTTSTILELPSINIIKDDVLGGSQESEFDLNEMFLNECMEKFTTEIIKDHEIAINYAKLYKGFIFHDEKIVIVFEIPQNITITNNDLTVTVIDEIINKKKVGNTPIDENIRKFLYDNLNCLYITSDGFENIEIPQVFYGEESIVRTISEYGFFYKLSSVPSETLTKKYVGFTENNIYYVKKQTETSRLSETDIDKEFDAPIIVEPEGIYWYFKWYHMFSEL